MTDSLPPGGRGEFIIEADDAREHPETVCDLDDLVDLARRVLREEGVDDGALGLHLVDSAEIAALKLAHFGYDEPTDVLAFPIDGADDPGPGPRMLGDLVLCPEVAAAQAADHVGSYDGELALLVIHGILHLLGHDHAEPDEAERMRRRERHHLEPLGYRHPIAS